MICLTHRRDQKDKRMIDLSGKRALVAGGSRGIGAAIALALAENGADVAFTYQNSAEKAKAVARSIGATGRRAVAIRADSADPEAITRAVGEAVAGLGGLDILINSGAIGYYGPIAELDLGEYQKLMDVNVRAPMLFAKAAIPHLPAGGSIVSIGSGLGQRVPFPGVTAYAVSKAALTSFTRGLSREPRRRRRRRLPAEHDVAGTLCRAARDRQCRRVPGEPGRERDHRRRSQRGRGRARLSMRPPRQRADQGRSARVAIGLQGAFNPSPAP
jgi:NAD(P)-dependent dehydrogenase (short-subunit alcohol dehydrogenase family)